MKPFGLFLEDLLKAYTPLRYDDYSFKLLDTIMNIYFMVTDNYHNHNIVMM